MDQQMSYFLPPITNTLPTGNCTLREVYRWITEDKSLETVTNELRTFIRELNYNGEEIQVADGKVGPVAQKLYDNLYGMQTGTVPDTMGWTYKLF